MTAWFQEYLYLGGMNFFTIPLVLMTLLVSQPSFKQAQMKHARVKNAYDEKEAIVQSYFSDKHIVYGTFELFIRIFKKEMSVEVWVRPKQKTRFVLLHTYDFCQTSGELGPKRKEGDLQIPEGIYFINHFNPVSTFHLSLGINYPNASDKILSNRERPGGAIYIHGNCVTVGCVPITDEKIKELYLIAVEARTHGQIEIPVHIFPSRLSTEEMTKLEHEHSSERALVTFWKNLKHIYDDFEKTKVLTPVKVDSHGKYILTP